jgi:hypothetical protein
MKRFLPVVCLCALPLIGQDAVKTEPAPIYRVTVERRAIRAVNYGQRTEPTRIGFQGTVLLPKAAGEARVKGAAGAVEIEAEVKGLEAPTRFGAQYLTYVLWAISPDGRPQNLGEILTDASDKGKLKVTTPFQTFGLIVTAEPYFAVTQPSNVVVLENVVLPETVGKVTEVEAKHELLPRGDYPGQSRVELDAGGGNTPKQVSTEEYDVLVALYQAQNALQIARSQNAARLAPDTMKKAEDLFAQAQALKNQNPKNKRVIMLAREAAQMAEDARTIARRR